MSPALVIPAPAKLNLFLHVGEKRDDGYHDIQSLVAFSRFGDEISAEPDTSISLSSTGPFGAHVPTGEENLALKAAKLFAETIGTRQGARIALRKNLPVAAGLGGGSADAAAVLRGLAILWHCHVDRGTLHDIGASLGADVPVCIDCVTSWIEGRGEHVRPLPPLPDAGVLLVNPGVFVSTAQVFEALRQGRRLNAMPPTGRFDDVYALVRCLQETANDLENPAKRIAPQIDEVLWEIMQLPDVLFARMSGSGATCFALFVDSRTARAAASLLRARRSEWWIVDTSFKR